MLLKIIAKPNCQVFEPHHVLYVNIKEIRFFPRFFHQALARFLAQFWYCEKKCHQNYNENVNNARCKEENAKRVDIVSEQWALQWMWWDCEWKSVSEASLASYPVQMLQNLKSIKICTKNYKKSREHSQNKNKRNQLVIHNLPQLCHNDKNTANLYGDWP